MPRQGDGFGVESGDLELGGFGIGGSLYCGFRLGSKCGLRGRGCGGFESDAEAIANMSSKPTNFMLFIRAIFTSIIAALAASPFLAAGQRASRAIFLILSVRAVKFVAFIMVV